MPCVVCSQVGSVHFGSVHFCPRQLFTKRESNAPALLAAKQILNIEPCPLSWPVDLCARARHERIWNSG